MSKGQITWPKLIIRFSVLFIVLGGLMFIIAGRLNWLGAWGYLGAIVVVTFWGRAVVMRKDPALLQERAQSLRKEDVKRWDRVLMPLVAIVLPILMLFVAAVDVRLDWTPRYHVGWEIGALVVTLAGLLIANQAFIENSFFSGTVRIQNERGHKVVSTGPYRWVRHLGWSVDCRLTRAWQRSLQSE
ncbi:MAG: hypothetical protein KAU31_09480 [Spirochaetaceae bacterium]|nr:hypothetical protein [Spirochaetaceae bacterium]